MFCNWSIAVFSKIQKQKSHFKTFNIPFKNYEKKMICLYLFIDLLIASAEPCLLNDLFESKSNKLHHKFNQLFIVARKNCCCCCCCCWWCWWWWIACLPKHDNLNFLSNRSFFYICTTWFCFYRFFKHIYMRI